MSEREPAATRIGRISGLVVFGWTIVWAAAIAVLGTDRRAFASLVRASGNVVVRVVLCAVVVAAAAHTVDGLRRVAERFRPDHPPAAERWRAATWFVAFALGVPAAAVLLWPFVEGRTG
jgi:succinate dehydrogenase/fumarate reductase cytochrome b subunit